MYVWSLLASRYLRLKICGFKKWSHGRKIHLLLSNTENTASASESTWAENSWLAEMVRRKVTGLLPCHYLILSSVFKSDYSYQDTELGWPSAGPGTSVSYHEPYWVIYVSNTEYYSIAFKAPVLASMLIHLIVCISNRRRVLLNPYVLA